MIYFDTSYILKCYLNEPKVEHSLLDSVCAAFESLPDKAPLRAGDAQHLACAREHGFREIYSNDRYLLNAAPEFGLVGKNVIV